jgi:hypothetical protein
MQRIGATLGATTARTSSMPARLLVALAAAMFFANGFAYAARGCPSERLGLAPGTAVAALGGALELPSPALLHAGVCETRCAQELRSDRRLSHEFPGPALSPVPVSRPASLAPPPAPALALAPQIVGPPLTILLRRLRN